MSPFVLFTGQCTAPLAPINPSIDVSGCTPRSTSSPSCTVKCAPGYIGASVPYVCAIAGMKTGWAGVPPTCSMYSLYILNYPVLLADA